MKTILLDLDNMTVLKLSDSPDAIKRLEYWADILIPKGEFYICGGTVRNLSSFTHLDIKMLYRNLKNSELMGTDYGVHLKAVHEIMQDMDIDDTTVTQLQKKLGRPLGEQTLLPVKEKPEPKSKKTGAVQTRPKAGTLTARVWECADWLYSQQSPQDINSRPLRDKVIETCTSNGVNPSTASTQYAKWKKDLIAG